MGIILNNLGCVFKNVTLHHKRQTNWRGVLKRFRTRLSTWLDVNGISINADKLLLNIWSTDKHFYRQQADQISSKLNLKPFMIFEYFQI